MITKEEMAARLSGREYLQEITHEEEVIAKESGLVVMFGYSDDNVELRGVIDDEIGAYDGTTISFLDGEISKNKCDDEDCPYFNALKNNARIKTVNAIWGEDISWKFRTDIPHATFDIFEDGEVFCRGIVFDVKSIRCGKMENKDINIPNVFLPGNDAFAFDGNVVRQVVITRIIIDRQNYDQSLQVIYDCGFMATENVYASKEEAENKNEREK